jgi:hypothetical protein
MDALKSDIKDATVVILYLSEKGNKKLIPILNQLKENSKIISFYFPLHDGQIIPNEIFYSSKTKIPIYFYLKSLNKIGK